MRSVLNDRISNSPENITMNNSKIVFTLLYKIKIDRITRTK